MALRGFALVGLALLRASLRPRRLRSRLPIRSQRGANLHKWSAAPAMS